MRILSLAALFLFSLSSLPAQDIRDTWNGRFPIPGIASHGNAVAVAGEEIAVLTPEGVVRFEAGVWGEPIPLPEIDYFNQHGSSSGTRNLALYNGEPWILGDTTIYRYSDGGWKRVVPPVEMKRRIEFWEGSAELAVVGDELFVTPMLHRWTGTTWERVLPDCITYVREAVASASGRWFLIDVEVDDSSGCDAEMYALLDSGVLSPVPSNLEFEGIGDPLMIGVAFDGETPVTAGHRFENGSWQSLDNSGWDEQTLRSLYGQRTIFPITGGTTSLYAVMPGWRTWVVSHGGGPLEPCSNRLYRLDGNAWQPVSGWFDGAADAVALWGDEGVVVVGDFSNDGADVVADHVAGYDGAMWETFGSADRDYTGIGGDVRDVELKDDSLWVGGTGLVANGIDGPSAILHYYAGRWHRVEGIEGDPRGLEYHDGRLYVAGSMTVNGDADAKLVRLSGNSREVLSGITHEVSLLSSEAGELYIGEVDRTVRASPRSTLYRLVDDSFEPLVVGWEAVMLAFTLAGDTIYVGGSEGKIAGYSNGRPFAVASPRGDRPRWFNEYPQYREGPRIDALLWHDGWLYVGGEFDSVADLAVGNIARYDGVRWEALESGVSRVSSYQTPECGELVHDGVRELRIVDGEILAGGVFRHISVSQPPSSPAPDREEVSVPLALYNPATREWRPATPSRPLESGERPEVRALDVDQGRIAIAGNFTLPGEPPSRNVAVNDRVASVRTIERRENPSQLPFRFVHRNGHLILETEESGRLTVELYDVGGRLLAQLFDENVEIGEREVVLPEGIGGAVLVVARDEEGRSVGEMVPGR